jgi:UDP-N-acetylmuramoyl-tripeptide--D-alanyl-D-alanine ligase
MFKLFIRSRLEYYVKKYFKQHPNIKLVVVTGSVGKTSTKVAIATVLSEKYRVRVFNGNYNTHLSAPLTVLGIDYPDDIRSLGAWLSVFRAAKKKVCDSDDIDVIVQELGADRIGEIAHFGTYLKSDIGVVTAVSAEHMEFFHDLDTVAKEELGVVNFSKETFINYDDVDEKYLKSLDKNGVSYYGMDKNTDYRFTIKGFDIEKGYDVNFFAPEFKEELGVRVRLLGDHNLKPAIAASAVAARLGLNAEEIKSGLSKIRAVNGRMNVLKGIKNSIIIDDTYNSSPLAAMSAMKTLCQLSAPQRIAVLGNMNELGDTSVVEHKNLGKMCDVKKLDWVITLGEDANKYTATEAKANGCNVKTFDNAVDVGNFVRDIIKQNAVILFKGSQGGVYLEEAVKIVLNSPDDQKYLVRQSAEWIKQKGKFLR